MAQDKIDLLHGSVWRGLIRLSIPILGSAYLETLYNLVDAIWIGGCGTEALAAVNLASFPLWMMFAISGIVTTGVNSLVAQKLGEGQTNPLARAQGRRIASMGLMMSILVGFLVGFVVVMWGREILSLMVGPNKTVESIAEYGYAYMGFIFLFAPIHFLNETISCILRAYGDTKTPLKIFFIGFIVNIILDPVCIYGFGPIPAMGVVGAAMATNLSFLVVLIILVWLLAQRHLSFKLPAVRPMFEREYVLRVIAIGLPPSLASMVFSFVYMAISPAVGHYGPEALAALGIGHRIEGLNYSMCFALSLACITMVGQNIGAGYWERAKQVAQNALILSAIVNLIVSSTFALFPVWYASWFLSEPVALGIAAGYLRIIALTQVFAGAAIVLEGVFSGAGRTLPPMLVSIPCSLLRIPAAYFVVFNCGMAVTGLWWVIAAMTVARGLAMFAIYQLGWWRPKERTLAFSS